MSSRHSAILNMRAGCDGAPEMWNLLEEGFIPQFGDNLHRLVDLHHLMEKLGAAARVIDDSKAAGARWKEETGQHILQMRALALSDRWGPAIALTLRPLRKAVRAA